MTKAKIKPLQPIVITHEPINAFSPGFAVWQQKQYGPEKEDGRHNPFRNTTATTNSKALPKRINDPYQTI
jgi:hypothetical protein